jgi:LacI family transcriptional regulator
MPPRRSRRSSPVPSEPRPAAATIKEVAAHAGVSAATVSRVLNHTGPVRAETFERVMQSAGILRYVPNAAARSLSIRKSHTIGVLLPDLYGEFFSEVIRGIDTAARARDHHLLVSGYHSDHREMAAMLASVRGRVDGLVVMSPDVDARVVCDSLPSDIPSILLNCRAEGHPSITIDNYGGAASMVRHLYELGHRNIAFIKGPDKNADASERLRGFRDSSAQLGLSNGSDALVELSGDFTEEGGYRSVLRLLSKPCPVSAIFAANDGMAIGALSALRELHIEVPEEVALVGFDDIPVARFINPPLTTIAVEMSSLGRRAIDLLFDMVAEDDSVNETLPTTLVVRNSCGTRHVHSETRQPIDPSIH